MPRVVLKSLVLASGVLLGITGGPPGKGLCAGGDAPAIQQPVAMGDALGWIMIRGDTVSLFYLPGANLKKIESKLRRRSLPIAREYRDLFTNKAYPIESRISARLQFLLMRTQDILGMKPQIPSISIKVFRSRRELEDECRRMSQGQSEFASFYIHALTTIFTSEKDIGDSVIAHEMAHSVMDYYFMAPPPPTVAELMARYVDEHLERD